MACLSKETDLYFTTAASHVLQMNVGRHKKVHLPSLTGAAVESFSNYCTWCQVFGVGLEGLSSTF